MRGPLVVVAIGWPLTATQRAVVDGLQREADARGHRFDGHVVASVRDAAALLGAGDDVHALLARRDARRLRRLSVSVRDAR